MSKTRIAWATHSDNAAAGCSEPRDANGVMDPACVNCYARLQSARCASMGQALYDGVSQRRGGGAAWTGVFRWSPELLRRRFERMRAGHRVFFGSMTDLFHAEHAPALLAALATEIRRLDHGPARRRPSALILLTKRPERLLEWQGTWFPGGLPSWVWPGVTAVTQAWVDIRVPLLLQVAAEVRVLSAEPLMEAVDVSRWLAPRECLCSPYTPCLGAPCGARLGWVIAGGESGRRARPSHPEWFRALRDQAVASRAPFHFKQWGEWLPISQMPDGASESLYRSRRIAQEGESQEAIDEMEGKDCTVPQLVLRTDGDHCGLLDPRAFRGDLPGWPAVLAFCVGKKAAGRTLDGRTWDELPIARSAAPLSLTTETVTTARPTARPLARARVTLDIEATGLDPVTDRIVEIALIRIEPDGTRKEYSSLVWPERAIPAEATAIHGISFADVEHAPPFSRIASKVHALLQDADVAGFGCQALDLPLLDEELRRCGFTWKPDMARVWDVGALLQELHPRNLGAMVRAYLGREHAGHRAMVDAAATAELLEEVLSQHQLSEEHALSLARHREEPAADVAGKLRRNREGDLCYAFGKNRGVRVVDDEGFGRWILRAFNPPFPTDTCEVLKAELDRLFPRRPRSASSRHWEDDDSEEEPYEDTDYPATDDGVDDIPDPSLDAIDERPSDDGVDDLPDDDIADTPPRDPPDAADEHAPF